MITIGIDPSGADKGHGVATYLDGNLIGLDMMRNVDIIKTLINERNRDQIIFSIENVLQNNCIFTKNVTGRKRIDQNISLKVGRCQQSQIELMWWLDDLSIPYVLHKPSSQWKENENLFKRITGWEKSSNKDTRSASYFGYLQVISK